MDAKKVNLMEYLDIPPMQSMADKIFEKFSGLIQDGTLPEGYTFPNENALCEQLHVGRTSLREAYKALELSGYVTRTKRGTVVNGKSAIIGATPMVVSIERSSEKDFLEFRIMLETESVRLAALRSTQKDIAELERLIGLMETAFAEDNIEDLMLLDRNFHKALAICGKNSLIIDTMLAVAEVWNRASKTNFFFKAKKDELEQMRLQHRALLEAIRKKDPDLAMSVMKGHIQYVSHK